MEMAGGVVAESRSIEKLPEFDLRQIKSTGSLAEKVVSCFSLLVDP